MRLTAALEGRLEEHLRAEIEAGKRAVIPALRAAAKGLRADLRKHTEQADLGRLGRAWAYRVYRNRNALDAAALIYPKGKSAQAALWSFEHGTVIRPTSGRFLAIPTQFNRKSGRRGGKVLFRPEQLLDPFVIKSKKGELLLMARVQHAQKKSQKTGRILDRAFVGSHALGSSRRGRVKEFLKHGVVPMFVLKREVRIKKRLNISGIARPWVRRTAEMIIDNWDRESGRARGRQ